MILFKKQLNARQSLRFMLIVGMIFSSREDLKQGKDMGRYKERQLMFFCKDHNVSRGDIIHEVLSEFWPVILNKLKWNREILVTE